MGNGGNCCRANSAHRRKSRSQSRPDYGLGVQAKVLEIVQVVFSSLGSGREESDTYEARERNFVAADKHDFGLEGGGDVREHAANCRRPFDRPHLVSGFEFGERGFGFRFSGFGFWVLGRLLFPGGSTSACETKRVARAHYSREFKSVNSVRARIKKLGFWSVNNIGFGVLKLVLVSAPPSVVNPSTVRTFFSLPLSLSPPLPLSFPFSLSLSLSAAHARFYSKATKPALQFRKTTGLAVR